jgi:hypothetical protein
VIAFQEHKRSLKVEFADCQVKYILKEVTEKRAFRNFTSERKKLSNTLFPMKGAIDNVVFKPSSG